MENRNVISIDHVSMRFILSQEKIDSLKEYVIKRIKRQVQYNTFWALKDITVEIKKGEVFGIVGYNGSGKSTLLKIVAGVMKPTQGRVIVEGSMAPLIELGAGFDPELSGRENIRLNAKILGLSNDFIRAQQEEIIEFAELQDFIDVALKNYSSGMKARLGFAVAASVNADILIVDEVLSVGDHKFQAKCMARIKELIDRGTTVLFVSHTLQQVEELCDRCLWVHKGEVKMIGPADEVCAAFLNDK